MDDAVAIDEDKALKGTLLGGVHAAIIAPAPRHSPAPEEWSGGARGLNAQLFDSVALLTFPLAIPSIVHEAAMTDLSYEGIEMNREHGPWEYPWRERIDRYLEAVENAFPWHHEASPWRLPVAPPTILGNATLRFIDSIAPVPPGTLHAKVEMQFGNTLRRDRELLGYGTFVEKYERRGRRWFVFASRWREGSGLLIGRCTVTMAFPEATGEGEGSGKKEDGGQPRKAELTLPARTLTEERMTAYSEDSANAMRGQSIHTDLKIANAKGYANTVAQGMMSADYISELLTGEMEKGWLLYGGLSLAFLRPVLCGDSVTAKASLRETADEGSFTRRVYDVWCENGAGETVTAGTASGLVPTGSPTLP